MTLYDEMQMMSSLLKEAEEHLEQQKQEIAAKQLELDAKMAQLENSRAQLENSQAQLDAVKRLNARLAELGRIDDIIKAASDEAYCSQLMKELNVK